MSLNDAEETTGIGDVFRNGTEFTRFLRAAQPRGVWVIQLYSNDRCLVQIEQGADVDVSSFTVPCKKPFVYWMHCPHTNTLAKVFFYTRSSLRENANQLICCFCNERIGMYDYIVYYRSNPHSFENFFHNVYRVNEVHKSIIETVPYETVRLYLARTSEMIRWVEGKLHGVE